MKYLMETILIKLKKHTKIEKYHCKIFNLKMPIVNKMHRTIPQMLPNA